jgi:hypothetical protein
MDDVREQVEGLRQERDRALADLQAAQIAQAEAEADAAELRQADAARRARGRAGRGSGRPGHGEKLLCQSIPREATLYAFGNDR